MVLIHQQMQTTTAYLIIRMLMIMVVLPLQPARMPIPMEYVMHWILPLTLIKMVFLIILTWIVIMMVFMM